MPPPEPRYQECPPWVKLWRCRHYLTVPHRTVLSHIRGVYRDLAGGDPDAYMGFREWWGLYTGVAQVDMNYVYTMDEVWDRLEETIDKHRK